MPRNTGRLSALNGGEGNPNFGKHHSAKTREIMSAQKMMTDPKSRWSWEYRARKAWKEARGPIPAGMLIHHIDENIKNYHTDNLMMITRAEHNKIHKTKAGRGQAQW